MSDPERPADIPELPPADSHEQPLPMSQTGERAREAADEVDEDSRESFPASDPPSFTRTTTGRNQS